MIKLFDKNMNEIKYDINNYIFNIFPLDNFSSFGFVMNDIYFKTSEHAFHYLKYTNNLEIANKIKDSFSPNEARELAIKNKKYRVSNWSDIKYKVMEDVLRLKVEQNPIVKQVLLDTKDYLIVENCIDEDIDWGLDNNNNGNNNLGKIWMKIRNDLKK